jgi:tetratricopeptide (TPR) repeat protein
LKTIRLAMSLNLFLLTSCAGVGVVDSSNPLRKLNDAEYLFMKENRPVPAERLILEAMAIYQKLDDPHGLGNANREYGDFLRSQAVVNWSIYRKGFLDPSVTFDNRLEKASEHYRKALDYYRLAETRELAAGQYDALTNVYFNMAWSHLALGANDEACADYDRALNAYEENVRLNPTAHPQGPVEGIPASIAAAKQRAGCRAAVT